MKHAIRFGLALGVVLCVSRGLGLYAQAQTGPSHSSADASPRDENGRPHCCPDGAMPEGVNQCWCDPTIVHQREYRNTKHEYEVEVPDGVAEILIGCGRIGAGFEISLTHPDTGERDGASPWNMISVRADRTGRTLQEMADQWAQQQKVDSERDRSTDLQIDPAIQIALSSLPAIKLRASRTQPDEGRLIYEAVDVKSLDHVYSLFLVTPADQYDMCEKLFKSIVDGFRYVPSGHPASQ